MQKAFVIIVGVLIVGSLLTVIVYFKQQVVHTSKALENERYNRLLAEEKVVNTANKIRQLETDLKSSQEKIEKIQTVLKQQKDLTGELQSQYEKLTKAKAVLEDKLRSALESTPSVDVQPQVTTVQSGPTNGG